MKKISSWKWILGGALYGVFVRALAMAVPATLGAMSAAFLVGTPFAVGAIAMYGVRDEKRTWDDYVTRPGMAVLFTMLGCAVTLLEGSICIVIMSPLFFACAWLGGACMGLFFRWRTPRRGALGAIAVLPALMFAIEAHVPLPHRALEIRDAIDIDAPPAVVWSQIIDARDIHPDELPPSLVHAIGVPRPLEGVNRATPDGEVRFSRWESGVNFRGRVVERVPARRIRWEYRFDEHSFPPGSMDEHVAIGGQYFDLEDTAFDLEPVAGGRTRLSLVAHYRVSSPVNFYAVPVSTLLGHDFVATILGLYKGRSERARAGSDMQRVAQSP